MNVVGGQEGRRTWLLFRTMVRQTLYNIPVVFRIERRLGRTGTGIATGGSGAAVGLYVVDAVSISTGCKSTIYRSSECISLISFDDIKRAGGGLRKGDVGLSCLVDKPQWFPKDDRQHHIAHE